MKPENQLVFGSVLGGNDERSQRRERVVGIGLVAALALDFV